MTKAHVYMQHHQGAKWKDFDVSDVIFHKISHGAASYTLNGENANMMLELLFNKNKEQFLFFKSINPFLKGCICWEANGQSQQLLSFVDEVEEKNRYRCTCVSKNSYINKL